MNSGLTESTAAQIRAVIANYPEVETVILYGSRAKGNYRQGSDIDLTLLGGGMTPSILGRIRNDFDDGSLPYRFDLSILSQVTDADLIDHIRRVGVVFYEKDPADRIRPPV